MLTGEPRSATVTAIEDATVYQVSGDIFRDFVSKHEELSKQLRLMTQERLSHAEKTVKAAQIETQKKEPPKADVTQKDTRHRKPEIETVQINRGLFGRWKKYPVIRQHSQMDCGAACLSTICKFYGKDVSITPPEILHE